MLFRIINNKLILSWVYSLLMIMTTTALADSEDFQFSKQLVAEQSNPWALPQVKKKKPGYTGVYNQNNQADSIDGQYSDTPYQGQQYQNRDGSGQNQRKNYWQPQVDRFVTPEFLESLKQQQKRYQIMPENRQNHEYGPQGSIQRSPEPGLPGLNSSGYSMFGPSYGKGSVNPLYDTPAESPWGGGAGRGVVRAEAKTYRGGVEPGRTRGTGADARRVRGLFIATAVPQARSRMETM